MTQRSAIASTIDIVCACFRSLSLSLLQSRQNVLYAQIMKVRSFTVNFSFSQSHEITNLETFTQYLVSVQVFNPEGLGPSSTVLIMTDEGGEYHLFVVANYSFCPVCLSSVDRKLILMLHSTASSSQFFLIHLRTPNSSILLALFCPT